jgi:hypothetical protein
LLTIVSDAPLVRTPVFLKHMGLDGSPNQKNGIERDEGKLPRERIERAREEVSDITDGLNLSIDEGIREAVAVLRALNVDTTQSCEGHLDEGSPSPYIDIRAPGEPDYHLKGSAEELRALADKHQIHPEEIRAWPNEKDRAQRARLAYDEWIAWCAEDVREFTPEYKLWDEADTHLRARFEELIAEFYSTRTKPTEGHVLLENDRLRTASSLYDRYFAAASTHADDPLSPTDRDGLRTSLPLAQAEMDAFIGFLKLKFFEEL